MIRILLTGCDGQVGWELQRALQPLGAVVALDRAACDLASPERLRSVVRHHAPDLIVNSAAYTAVDRAESEVELAMAVNGAAPAILGEEAATLGAGVVHYSTDYVFDGTKTEPYDEADATGPVSAYGRSKLAGEEALRQSGAAHLILRTSWVYAARGRNFLRTMLRLMREREELSVVSDQVGAPTSARLIASTTATVLARAGRSRDGIQAALRERGGTYHLAAGGATSWFGFAEFIRDHSVDPARRLRTLRPIATAQYPTPARRPANSRLCTDRLRRAWSVHLPDWTDDVRLCLTEQPDGVRLAEPSRA